MINKKIICYILPVFLLLASAFLPVDNIRYSTPPSIKGEITAVKKHQINFRDTIPNDTLYQNLSKEGYPLSYFRKITTGICFDNKCRILDIVLFWDITGRYLGFELPKGEFLSKTDHEPFKSDEYQRLNDILSDEQSPIAGFTYNQLIIKPQTTTFFNVDGVTGATAPAILDHVVPGAVYTTYQLWHFVYGQTKKEVEQLTIKALSADLVLKILDSKHEADKIWALDNIKEHIRLTPELKYRILQFIENENYSLAERAIATISPSELKDNLFQEALLEKFYKANHSLKQQLIEKLNEADKLSENVIKKLRDNINLLNAEMLGRVIDTFKKHHIADEKTLNKIIPLLKHENAFVRRKTYAFLANTEKQSQYVKDALKEYTTKYKE